MPSTKKRRRAKRHAENLAEYITGLQIQELAADITSFVKGRKLDDDANVLLRFKGGAKGVLHCSQISVGEENNLNIRVYGETRPCEQMEAAAAGLQDGLSEPWGGGVFGEVLDDGEIRVGDEVTIGED